MNTQNHTGHPHLSDAKDLQSTLPWRLTDSEAEALSVFSSAAGRLVRICREQIASTPSESLRIQRHIAWVTAAHELRQLAERRAAAQIPTDVDAIREGDERVCAAWSQAADQHIRKAHQLANLNDVSIIAMGKLGSRELNISSDVDLVLVSPDRTTEEEIRADQKAAQEFVKLLSENTNFGFCHRVDLGLRPGGGSAPAVIQVTALENHLGYHGELWERLAWVRHRFLLDPKNLQEQLRSLLTGFSFPRHLDYTVFEETRLLLSRIRAEYPPHPDGRFHLKLHPGGIRDIELFIHALQITHGGRIKQLASPEAKSTSVAIRHLHNAKLLDDKEAKLLSETYWHYRGIENQLQAREDTSEYVVRGPSEVTRNLRELAAQIVQLAERAFPARRDDPLELPDVPKLVEMGFSERVASECLERLEQLRAKSRRAERDERARRAFLTSFLSALRDAGGDLDLGLALLTDFVRSTRVKASFFSLLNAEPSLIKSLAVLFSVSPWAGHTLAGRPELLDSIILRADAELPKDPALADLAFEALAERRLVGELLALLDFAADNDLDSYLQRLTSLADQIATDSMLICANELGIEPLGLIALGKWGGREFGAKSDLDFVFLVRGAPQSAQQKLARRFIHRLTESRRGGQLYSIDLRLRPSGHAGPILVEHNQLHQHLLTRAEAWERQSWLRARSLSEDRLGVKLDFSPSQVCRSRPWTLVDHEQVLSISRQLFKPLDANAPDLDLKLVRGGLASIEFAAQIDCLRLHELSSQFELEPSTQSMIHFLEGASAIWSKHSARLQDIYRRTRLVEQWHRLTGDVSDSKINFRARETDRVARRLGLRDEDEGSSSGHADESSRMRLGARLKSFLLDGLRESDTRLAEIEADRA